MSCWKRSTEPFTGDFPVLYQKYQNQQNVLKYQRQSGCETMLSSNLVESENRLERVWQSNTPSKMLSLRAIRQCPAESVVPVLTPSQPFSNSLFVFFQLRLLLSPQRSFFMTTSCSLVLTTFRKVVSVSARAVRETIERGVEMLGLADRPWLLPHSCFSPSSFEKRFIWFRKVSRQVLLCSFFLCRWMTLPISSARQTEASLPEGSMRAKSRSQPLRISPATSSAEVPGKPATVSGTLYQMSLRFTSYFLEINKVKQQVIILLREAISISSSAPQEFIVSSRSKSKTYICLAVTALLSIFSLSPFAQLSFNFSQNPQPPY